MRSLITCIFCSSFRVNLGPIVFLVRIYHIVCKYVTYHLFNDKLSMNNGSAQHRRLWHECCSAVLAFRENMINFNRLHA